MARLKTRSISADRHRRAYTQPPAGPNSGIHDLSEQLSENSSEEQPRLGYVIQAPELKADIPLADIVDPKPVSDLALDLVLNEIVLQARLTTNATGAIIALERSRKLVSRATTGATSAEIAAFLNMPSGVSMTCFETGDVRRIDEVVPDSHADSAAYQRAGVRSILVVPVSSEDNHLLGILQSFSPRPNAFCDRDVLTLQALARRIAANIELVRKSTSVSYVEAFEPLPQTPDPVAGQIPRQARPQTPPQAVTGALAKRWQGAPAVWASMLGRTALVFVLLAACVSAGKFWMRSRGTSQTAIVHRSAQIPVPQAVAKPTIAANPVPPEINSPHANPTISKHETPSHQISKSHIRSERHSTPSIIIERKPIHKEPPSSIAEKAAPDKTHSSSGEIVLFEDHSPVPEDGKTQQAKSSSQAPAMAGVEAISTQAAMARLVQRVEPEYPNAARQKHIQGSVLLDVVVNENGAVDELALVSGESQLMPAAEQAVRQWHFQPLVKSGHAKKFESRIGIDFTLASEGSSSGR